MSEEYGTEGERMVMDLMTGETGCLKNKEMREGGW